MMVLLLNHLWQSSLCAGAAALIALALHRNSAHIRFWLWFCASVKFLVPFAALTALAAYALTPIVPATFAPTAAAIEPLATPFSAPVLIPAGARMTESFAQPAAPAQRAAGLALRPPAPFSRPAYLSFHLDARLAFLAIWAGGVFLLSLRWFARWRRMRVLLDEAEDVPVDAPVAVKFSPSQLEPGLFGIFRPVILLPRGIDRQLSPAELQAVLAHELCHWRRHDNLLAAIHMLVEALFWFFPPVWWIGARLNAERERACDESVLADGNDPHTYAESILKVCRAYLQSPLACAAGVSGGDLKKRIETIAENRLILRLNATRKFVLSAFAGSALALPLALGLAAAPLAQIEAKAAPVPFPNPVRAPLPPGDTAASADDPLPARPPKMLAARKLIAPPPDMAKLLPNAAPQLVALNDAPAATTSQSNTSREDTMLKQALAASIALLGLDGAAAAQTGAAAAQAGAARTCPLPSLVDSAPLQQVPGSTLMTVPVAINGTSKQFLLDIGAGQTQISQAAVAQLGLPQATKLTESIGAGRSSDMTPHGADLGALTNGGLGAVSVYDVRDKTGAAAAQTRVRIASFTVGGATGKSLQFLVANDAQLGSQSEPYDGLLTGDFFKQYDVELDFGGKQINWLTPTQCTDPNQVVFWSHSEVAVIPMTMVDGKISVPVSVQGHQINAAIDTSSSRTVMRRDIAELLLGLKAGTDMTLNGDLKDGKGQPVYDHTFSQISFAGGVTANNVPALILANTLTHEVNSGPVLGSWARSADARIPDLTLGMDVLRQLHLYVVPGQGKVYATAAE